MIPTTTIPLARRRLLERIHRRYETVTEDIQVAVGDQTAHFPFTRIADPNRVLDQVAEEEDRLDKLHGSQRIGDVLHLPYWAELWDSALGMGQLLVRHWRTTFDILPLSFPPTDPLEPCRNTMKVMDLGCGMGFTGMVAGSLGADVLFADLESPALLFAQLNSVASIGHVRTRQLDWRTARLNEAFDLILGCDVIYERKQWEYLEAFWRHHLADGGRVLLGEPGRQTGDLFIDWIGQRGWALDLFEEPIPTRSRPIRLFSLSIPYPPL